MSLSRKSLVRHAGLDPASRDLREPWIPVFTGMTENKTCRKIVTPAPISIGINSSRSPVWRLYIDGFVNLCLDYYGPLSNLFDGLLLHP